MTKKIKVGIIGLGTVGSGVLKIITESRDSILKKSGLDIEIAAVCDTNKEIQKSIPASISFTDNYKDLINDSSIDVIVELIGGLGIAKDIVISALKASKTVVSANKALLAEKGQEIFPVAWENKKEIGFEAAVAGTIPVIRALQSGLSANTITSIYGILNGTSNYILTKMAEQGMEYSRALTLAQELGFAEADPTLDIGGGDAAHKIYLLAWLAFGKYVDFEELYYEGIDRLTITDFHYAEKLGYDLKLLAIAKNSDEGLDLRVHPTMIARNHILASVKNEYNAVFIEGNYSDSTTYIGKGAGSLPTASAVVADIIYFSVKNNENPELPNLEKGTLQAKENIYSRYYFRFSTVDKPGVLAAISKVLGKHNISISQMFQDKSDTENQNPVDVIIVTHHASEGEVRQAVKEIDTLSVIKNETVIIRVEE